MMKSLALLAFAAARVCSAAPYSSLTPASEQYLNDGVTSLYDLDYGRSRAAFHRIIETEPENPLGYLFESGGIWWEASQEYGLFKDTPTLQGQFEKDVDTALKKAERLAKSEDPRERADGHFAAGMALGTRGQWALMRGHMLRACFDGRKAVGHLDNAVKSDQFYYDAYLGLGVYDYQAARLGPLLRLSAKLCGAHGDEKRGLERIHLAMEKGRYGRRQAAAFLTSIYIADKRDYEQALPLLAKLKEDFPDSPYFRFLRVAILHGKGDRQASLEEGRGLFDSRHGDFKSLDQKWLSLFCGFSGEKCLDKVYAQEAYDWFTLAIDSAAHAAPVLLAAAGAPVPADPSEAWLSLNYLFRGHAADILGRRQAAIKDYEWVLAHADFSNFHSRAKLCLDAPCSAKSILQYLRALSRDEPLPASR